MEYSLATSPWPGVILWMILYISDYYLTIYSARGFRETGHFQFEGSFELTPQYQKDINALKPVSKLHIALLVLYSGLILFLWWLTSHFPYFPWTYLLYLGMFLLVEVGVHLRHLRNIFIIRELRKGGGLEGQIFYRKWFSYRISAAEFYTFSVLFLMIAVLAYSAFFLGGAIMCFATALKHSLWARKTKTASLQPLKN
ncbi:MAG TPA: hypothetical protein VK897_18565 [Anaerolineales bacterium]|nr:hypothetical protein [Anaerolineales bacterium]